MFMDVRRKTVQYRHELGGDHDCLLADVGAIGHMMFRRMVDLLINTGCAWRI